MNANKILFRCSSLGYIMTEPRTIADRESGKLSETCIKHLVDKYVSVMYDRHTDIENRYTKKGLQVEEDSVTLYSRMKKKYFLKNEENIVNQFICGTPDLYTGESICKAETIIELKSSWDIFTFHRAKFGKLDKMYYWQVMGYLALTSAKTGLLPYCLIDTPEPFIIDEKRKLQWKMGVINPDNDKLYQDACAEIEKNMTYSDIPLKEKMFERVVVRDNEAIERIYKRVEQCRKYMNAHLFGEVIKTEAAVEL